MACLCRIVLTCLAASTHVSASPIAPTQTAIEIAKELEKIIQVQQNRKAKPVRPMALYWKGNKIKVVKWPLVTGKKDHDKRDRTSRGLARDKERLMKKQHLTLYFNRGRLLNNFSVMSSVSNICSLDLSYFWGRPWFRRRVTNPKCTVESECVISLPRINFISQTTKTYAFSSLQPLLVCLPQVCL